MEINGVPIDDTFAEAFSMHMNRTIITAYDADWARTTALETTGFGTSVIMTPAEAGIEYVLGPDDTPDGRPGVRVIFATAKKQGVQEQLLARLGQCVLTSPTACAYDDTPNAKETYPVGKLIAMFGDGHQVKKGPIGGRVLWLVPRMSGTFVIQESFGRTKGVAGGNIIYFCKDVESGMTSGKAAVKAIEGVEGAYTPFPGGLVGSGSKPSSRYKALHASTNERYCPTMRGVVPDTFVPKDCDFVVEIVINGLTEKAVADATKTAILEVCKHKGVIRVSAGNFGGALGKYKIHLHELGL
ncbi:MAG: formylmethanofuran--tetrahydromethanopterin N-formyltransferase [Candidatus Thorarchaeota archaeon]|nr:MAG: formylmethanofuran--tetrahydromethanopterin N-formyltransferase [Candidatus Thorarchaeota archaeon]